MATAMDALHAFRGARWISPGFHHGCAACISVGVVHGCGARWISPGFHHGCAACISVGVQISLNFRMPRIYYRTRDHNAQPPMLVTLPHVSHAGMHAAYTHSCHYRMSIFYHTLIYRYGCTLYTHTHTYTHIRMVYLVPLLLTSGVYDKIWIA